MKHHINNEDESKLSDRGIEIGKTIELWKHPSWYSNIRPIEPKDEKHYIKYKDAYGVFHSALLLEKYFVKIINFEKIDANRVKVFAESEDGRLFTTYTYTHNGEWNQLDVERKLNVATFCTAIEAYNTSILILDKNGKRGVPEIPISVCEKHDCAFDPTLINHANSQCLICSGYEYQFEDWMKPKLNPVRVTIDNKNIYIVE
jgi:hypothetical protein